MMHQTRFTLLFVLLVLCSPFAGCGIDTNPFPGSSDDSSAPVAGAENASGDGANEQANETSDPDSTTDSGDMGTCDTAPDESNDQGREPYSIFHANQRQIVVGEVESVNPNGLVQLFNAEGTELIQTSSASDGSFALESDASLPESIRVQSSNDSDADIAIQVGLTDATTAAYESSLALNQAWSESDSSGDAGFSDDSGLSLETAGNTLELRGATGTFLPGLTVVLANLSQSMAMASQVNIDGSFSTWVEAESGDTIAIFTVEHGSSNGGGTPLIIQAP
ncbi:MAG: hypothetical protein HOI23_01305 [Deltaproteobacteria bacterium]|nr:hypothetical protein [Deltaproteobacteria bacterium]MBT6436246.1 hypothetical protein [Deltaproteobacteria bacterium]